MDMTTTLYCHITRVSIAQEEGQLGSPYHMSYETYSQQENESESIGPTETRSTKFEGITQLPGYESVQARLQPPRGEQRPTKDDIFDILRNRRRRYVLEYLGEHEGVVELSELAEALANWENEEEGAYITHRDRKRAYVSLYQTHLPKLDRAGIVEYNQPRGTVETGPDYRYVTGYLHHTHDSTLLWHRLYLGSAAASVGVLGLVQLTAFPFVAVSDAVWFVFVLIVFASIVLAQSVAVRSTIEEESQP